MPTSFYEVIPKIVEQVISLHPKSILDVGIGFGKYGTILRENLDIAYKRYDKENWKVIIDGIEGFKKYKNPIHEYIYNKIYYEDASKVVDSEFPSYDCILLIDILEHFDKKEGIDLIDKLLLHTKKSIIISTPLFPSHQQEYLGNKLEKHKSRWSPIDFKKYDFSFIKVYAGEDEAEIFHIFPKEKCLNCSKKMVFKTKSHDKKLNIGYILPHKNLTGGMKMLLLQMDELSKRGHNVFAFYKGENNEDVLPQWLKVNTHKNILVPFNKSYKEYTKECDIVVSGWIQQMMELKDLNIPVVYIEQGTEILFGDLGDLSKENNMRKHFKECYSFNINFASVSSTIQEILKVRYDKDSVVIPNFIDCNFYYPANHKFTGTILLVGNPKLQFKGFNIALTAMQQFWNLGYRFKTKWICQTMPEIQGITFPIQFIQKPSQFALAKEYREADVCICASWYEGFGMIPLESMASGTPVITTNCGGINDYVKKDLNAIVVEPGDIKEIVRSLRDIFEDEKLRSSLSKNGRETALKFSKENIIPKLEEFLFSSIE